MSKFSNLANLKKKTVKNYSYRYLDKWKRPLLTKKRQPIVVFCIHPSSTNITMHVKELYIIDNILYENEVQ